LIRTSLLLAVLYHAAAEFSIAGGHHLVEVEEGRLRSDDVVGQVLTSSGLNFPVTRISFQSDAVFSFSACSFLS
jgi:hypothetical protein